MSTEKFIDCRSDTVTLPSPEMKQAMMEAPLGDDVFGDDPTVKKLEKYMADKFGKQAGLFFPTGTMSNLCALMAHTNRGEAILTGDLNHIVFWEQGGLSQIGNIPSFQLETLPDSTFDLVKLKQKLDTFAPIGKNIDQHHAKISCISLENPNTQNKGICFPFEFADQVKKLADEHQVAMHLDGARCLSAIHKFGLYSDEGFRKFAAPFDTVNICLSKAVGSPVGSILVGSTELIQKAHRIRKVLGGTMRQSGILAAAGLYGMEHVAPNMHLDNEKAEKLSNFVRQELGLKVGQNTNAMFITMPEGVKSTEVVASMKEDGILALPMPPNDVRLVFHLQVSFADLEVIQKSLVRILGSKN